MRELPQPPPPQWRRQRPNSAVRLPREHHEWRPFESFSKGTPPPGWRWMRPTRAAVGTVAPPPVDGEGQGEDPREAAEASGWAPPRQ